MATAYTSILKLALPVQGELSGTWGDVVNDNITSMVEEAIAGRAVINTWTTNSHTLTSADGTTSESRCAMLEFTDTGTALTGDATVVCPTQPKIYICKNGAGQKVTIKTSAGTGVAIADGQTMFVFCDGTNVVEAVTSMSSLKLGTAATSVQVTAILDEDNMASDSATSLATQQSIKAYVDSQVTAQDLDFGGDSGTGSVDLDSQTFTIAGTANEIETSASGQTLTVGLPAAITVTTSVTTPLVQATNVNANDGSSAIAIADSTGQTTINDAVLTTADINAGTIDNTTIGATTASTGAFTTITSSGNTTVSGSLVTDTISEETATAGVTVDGVLLKDGGATLTGDLTVDTDTLYVDSANDRVGVGTASPQYLGHFVDGDVAIVDTDATNNAEKQSLLFGGAAGEAAGLAAITGYRGSNATFGDLIIKTANTGTLTEAMRIDSSQRVLIGGQSDSIAAGGIQALLQVEGTGGDASFSLVRHSASVNSSYFTFGKSRGADATIVQNGDNIGFINFAGADGTDINSYTAYIASQVDGTPGSNDMPGRLTFYTTADGTNNPTERMRINRNGDVDIGQTGGGVKLAVAGAVGPQNGTAAAPTHTFYSDTDTGMYRSGANALGFSTGGSNAMTIDSSRRVLMGTTPSSVAIGSSAQALMQVHQNATTISASFGSFNNNVGGPVIALGHSRSTTVGTPGTVVSSGDSLGTFRWAGDDGTDMQTQAAKINVAVDGTPGSNDMPGRLQFYTTADGASSPTERVRIDSDGLLSAYYNMKATRSVYGGYTALTLENSNANAGVLNYVDLDMNAGTTGAAKIRMANPSASAQSDGQLIFQTTSSGTLSEAMRIDSSQRVLIGHTTAQTFSLTPKLALIGSDASSSAYQVARFQNGAFASYFQFAKSRATTVGSNAIVQSGDTIGNIRAMADDGTDYDSVVGSIEFQVDGTPGTNDTPGRIVFGTTPDGSSGPSERMRINNSGDIFIGKTTGSLGVAGTVIYGGSYPGLIESTADNLKVMTLNRENADGEIIDFRKNASQIGEIGVVAGDNLYIGSTASGHTGISFGSNEWTPMSPVGTNADDTVDIGAASRRIRKIFTSQGIFLGGTSSSNQLEDYEEGTFTPTLDASSASPTVSYIDQYGAYTKVGRLVTVDIYLITGSRSGGTGDLRISNLPFTVSNNTNHNKGTGAVIGYKVNTEAESVVIAIGNTSTLGILARLDTSASGTWGIQPIGDWSAANTVGVRCSISYITDS